MSLGLNRLSPNARRSGPGSAQPDATGLVWTVTGLTPNTDAILYGAGVALQTVKSDGTGKATWTLSSLPAEPVNYDGMVSGSAGSVPKPAPGALTISGAPGNSVVNDNPTFAPTISGGAAPYTLSLDSGTLPPGRTVNGTAKTVTGAYTTAGSYNYVLKVTDALGAVATLTVSVVVSAASAVLPVSNWRVPLSAVAVTGSTADAANQSALLASPTNKDLVTLGVAANATVTMDFDIGAVAAPGAVLYLTTSTGSPTSRTLSASLSTDGGTTYNPLSYTPIRTVSGTDNTDQLIDIPAGPAGKLRVTYASTGAAQFRVQTPCQLQTDPLANPIFAVAGMSITISNTAGGVVADDARRAMPGSDPIFLAIARSGAKPSDMLTQQLQGIVQPRAYMRRVILDMGPNEFLASSAPYASLPQSTKDSITAGAQGLASWAAAQSRTISYVGPNFINPANFDSGTATNILQENVTDGPNVSIANQANGMRPLLIGAYYPTIKAAPGCWNMKYDAPAFDGYAASLLHWDLWKGLTSGLTAGDGTHPSGPSSAIYRMAHVDAWLAIQGQTVTHYLERKIAAAEPATNAAQKARLYTALASLPDTADSAAISARAALKTRIDNIATTYAEPGPTAPSALPGILASFDFDDMTTLWSDDAASKPAKDYELVRVASSKVGSLKLVNAQSAASPPYRQPQALMGQAAGQKFLAYDGVNSFFDMADAALYGSLDAAGQPFIIGWSDTPTAPSGTTAKVLWQFLASGGLTVRYAVSSSKVQLVSSAILGSEATDAVLNAAHVYVLTYDGTTIKLRRDGVETVSAAWSKAAWTATGGKVGAAGFAGRRKGWHMITGAWTTATRDALEARLKTQAGL